MKYLAILAALAVTPAAAADLPVKATPAYAAAAYSWSGIYLSGYADYGINFGNTSFSNGILSDSLAAAPHGPGIGGELAALYQLPSSPWVLGVTASIGYANMQGSINAIVTGVPGSVAFSNATNYLGAANAVLGLTLSQDQKLLGYVTGGLGFGGAKPNLTAIGTSQGISDTAVGWDVGLGLKYALTSNINLFIEGDYFDLGHKSFTVGGAVTSTTPYNIFEQKIGLGFKF